MPTRLQKVKMLCTHGGNNEDIYKIVTCVGRSRLEGGDRSCPRNVAGHISIIRGYEKDVERT
jgi:hypothetical protein